MTCGRKAPLASSTGDTRPGDMDLIETKFARAALRARRIAPTGNTDGAIAVQNRARPDDAAGAVRLESGTDPTRHFEGARAGNVFPFTVAAPRGESQESKTENGVVVDIQHVPASPA